MRHTASDINELKHWFANQFVLVFDRTTTDMPSVIDVRRNEDITDAGACGNVRYEPMTQWAWEQHELYTPESLRPSVLFSWRTPIAVIFPTQRVLLVTSTTHSSYTSRHMPHLSDIPDRSQWTQIDACLDPQTIDDRHTSYVDQRGGYRTISGPTQWVAAGLSGHPTGAHVSWAGIYELFGNYPRLRVVDNEVQTSFGARVSVKQAARAWPVLQRVHKRSQAQEAVVVDVRELSFTPYHTQSFDGDTLVVGCHSIPWSEIELIAPQVMAAAAASTAIEEQTV